jgi:hypothetical protein
MSKNEKCQDFYKKLTVFRFVTRMLRKIFLGKKKCDDKIIYFLRKELKHNFLLLYMTTNDNNSLGKLCFKFYCEKCDYGTCKKSSFTNHTDSKRHKNNVLTTNNNKLGAKTSTPTLMCSICDKTFNDRAGLWRHKKKCTIKNNEEDKSEENGYYEGINIKDKDALVLHLLKQNSELQKSLIEMSKDKSIINNTNNTNNTNCHNTNNNAFNLNFFLNETCKDALNITDFVSSIKLSLDDLENTGRKGYIEGISNIILKQLNKLGHYDRPIHCADQKREVLYIKNDNQWIKESEEKPLLTKAIKTIANENIKQIKTWREQNPDCTVSDSKKNSLYLKIVSNSMSGSDKEECDKNLNKIISNVAKETIIPKDV